MSDNDMIRRGEVRELLQQCGLMGKHPNDPLTVMFNAIPAAQVTVKPLEWRTAKISDKWERWIADTIFGQYEILEYSNGSFGWNICFYDEDLEALQYATKNIEAAKAAAQADYDARIRSALTVTTIDPAKALRRAAELVQTTAYTSNGDGRSLEPVSAGLVGMDMHHATIADAILALIPKEGA